MQQPPVRTATTAVATPAAGPAPVRVMKGNSIEAAPTSKSTWVVSTAEGRTFYFNSVRGFVRGCDAVLTPCTRVRVAPRVVPRAVFVAVSSLTGASVRWWWGRRCGRARVRLRDRQSPLGVGVSPPCP